jgi:hypothetical protein
MLANEHAASPYHPMALLLMRLRGEIGDLARQKEKQDQRIRQLNAELDRLKQIDERLRNR